MTASALASPPHPASAVPVPAPAPAVVAAKPAPSPTPQRDLRAVAATPQASALLARRIKIVLNPGHNGGNASHPGAIRRQVPAGFGQRKDCDTTGTATNAGYAEHAFTWDVALRVRKILQSRGITVILTRPSDRGVGPCVDQRARIGNQSGVAGVVAVHDALRAHSGLTTSTYPGRGGYFPRSDLAGLNLATVPATFLEIGNMHNRGDAALQRTSAGRQRIAAAVADGILTWLGR